MADPTLGPQVALARRLFELRNERGLTQEALARAFSIERKVSGPTVSSWESERNPKIPTLVRLDAYARLFATDKSFEGPTIRPLVMAELEQDPDDLDRYRELRDELLTLLHASDPDESDQESTSGRDPASESDTPERTLLQFDEGDIVIVCPEAPKDQQGPLADQNSVNFARLHRFADPDALLEVFGHLRALNPDRKVFARTTGTFRSEELQSHLILIGGIGWSRTARQILSKLEDFPLSQIEHPQLKTGEVFRIDATGDTEEQLFFPTTDTADGEPLEDVALIARVRNPLNSSRTLTILNGIHSRGVLGAALAVTDETIRVGNQKFLAERFPSGDFAMLLRVDIFERVPVAPDFNNAKVRLFEWSPGESTGE